MVGLLNGMDNEDRSSVALGDSKDVSVVQEDSSSQKPSTDESQPAAENTDNVDEVEHVKELKSILKQRGQYTFRKVKVDFDLTPKKIPYDEDDYTIDIQFVEKEPVKIKSWAAIFAAKKAEAEAEAAAIAEAEEALKKAEEVTKREALKKANKAKLKKSEDHPQSNQGTSTSGEQNEQQSSTNELIPSEQAATHSIDQTSELMEPELRQQSTNQSLSKQQTQKQEPLQESIDREEIDNNRLPSTMEVTSELAKPHVPSEDYELSESILEEVLNTVVSREDLLSQELNIEHMEVEQNTDQKDEESSCNESLATERSEHLQDEHTNDDLDEISTHEETSVSQLLDDSNLEENLSRDTSHSQVSHTESDLEGKSSAEDVSQSHSDDITNVTEAMISHSDDDSSSKLVDLQGKKVPKKMLVTAASLVEEILSEMPKVIQKKSKNEGSEEPIPLLNENNERKTSIDVETSLQDSNLGKNKDKKTNLESGTRRKRRDFKKTSDSSIFEHVKQSLESAAPEILETAVGVLEEIEKIVIEKVGPLDQRCHDANIL